MSKIDLNTLGGRLWSLAKGRQMSDKAFGELFNRTAQGVNKWFHNKSRPSSDMLEAIAHEMGANLTWLITGTGEPSRVQGTVRMIQDLSTVRSSSAPLQVEPPRAVDAPAGVSVTVDDAHRARGLDWIPTLTPAGRLSGAPAVDNVPTFAAMRAASLRDEGLSADRCVLMSAPNAAGDIREGDAVMVDREVAIVADGRVYAVEVDGVKMLRKIYRRPGGKLLLRSDEDDYEITSDAKGFLVLGEVVWRGGYLR